MAAIVCHGLQSCLDSHLVESRIHSLRLPSPKPQSIDLAFNKPCFWESNTKLHCEENMHSYKTDTTVSSNSNTKSNHFSWSNTIQSLSNVSQDTKESTYVPPHVKNMSWMRLSPKSLELCTENLGNETGTDITESSIDLLSSKGYVGGGNNMELKEQGKLSSSSSLSSPCQVLGAKKVKSTQNFPPPLTTMRGSESLRVRPHREGGRLVIEVTKVPSSASCFKAERSNGRLRLCFWNDVLEDEEEFETGEEEDEEEEVEEEEEGIENTNENENENENEGETRVDECNNTNKESKGKGTCWSIGGSDVKYERAGRSSRRRCKEEGEHGKKELLYVKKWGGDTLWVATS